jgi:hypothetical protein
LVFWFAAPRNKAKDIEMKIYDGSPLAINLLCRLIIPVLLCLGCVFAYGANLFSNDTHGFSDEERHEFQEAPNRFHKTILPHLIPYGGVIWIDNQHVIMTVRELPNGWNANTMPVPVSALSPTTHPQQGNSRIITVDVKTGEINDAPYSVGHLNCYADEKIVVEVASETGGGPEYYKGQYGSALDKMEVEHNSVPHLIGVGCNQIEVTDKFLVFHLLPQHGTLKVTRFKGLAPVSFPILDLSDPDDHLIATIPLGDDARPLNLRYLPYLNQYVEERGIISDGGINPPKTEHAGWLFSPDGKFSHIESDPFLSQMIIKYPDPSYGAAGVRVTKVGLLWVFAPMTRYWKQRGLYFRENGKMLRLDDNSIGTMAVSPDGCKLSYQSTSGNPNVFKEEFDLTRRKLVVMDLCEQKK